MSNGYSQSERKKRKHLHSNLCLVAFVNLSSEHIHRQTLISSYFRLTRGDKNNFSKRGLEKVGEILTAITTKHPANPPDPWCPQRNCLCLHTRHWGQAHSVCEGLELLVASPMCSFGDPLQQDSFSLLPLLRAQDSPCSPTFPSSRNTRFLGSHKVGEPSLSSFVCWCLTRLISTQVTLRTCLLEHYEELEFLNISSWGWEMCLELFSGLGLVFLPFSSFWSLWGPHTRGSAVASQPQSHQAGQLCQFMGEQQSSLSSQGHSPTHSWLLGQFVVMLMCKAVYVPFLSGALCEPPWSVM